MKSQQPPKAPITTTKTWPKTFADMGLNFLGWGNFISALRGHYEADNELPALVIDPSIPKVSLAHCFVNLALIEQVTQEKQEKALLCGEATADAALERGELYQSLLNDGKSRGVGELFDRAKLENREEPAGWVCITGRAGTGKTTLLQYIANRWGLRESLWNNRFEFVFRAKLNLLGQQNFWEGLPSASSEHYLSWLIYKSLGESSQLSLENIHDALTNRPNQILLLLDGFDEVQALYGEDRDMRVTGLINVALQLPNGILTSRPNAIPPSFIPKFKQRFENLGLTQDNVRYYVQHYFDALSQPQLGESLLRELSTHPEMILNSPGIKPIIERDAFKALVLHGFSQAGVTSQLLSDSAIELIRMASQGNPRKAHQLIATSMRIAADRQINHLPDDIIQDAINMFK